MQRERERGGGVYTTGNWRQAFRPSPLAHCPMVDPSLEKDLRLRKGHQLLHCRTRDGGICCCAAPFGRATFEIGDRMSFRTRALRWQRNGVWMRAPKLAHPQPRFYVHWSPLMGVLPDRQPCYKVCLEFCAPSFLTLLQPSVCVGRLVILHIAFVRFVGRALVSDCICGRVETNDYLFRLCVGVFYLRCPIAS